MANSHSDMSSLALTAVAFALGIAVGYRSHRIRRRIGRHMTRHVFVLDLPDGCDPELAERPFYQPVHKSRL